MKNQLWIIFWDFVAVSLTLLSILYVARGPEE